MTKRNRHQNKSLPDTHPLIDVVITTSGRFDMLKKCLAAFKSQEDAPPYNIIIVDDGSDSKERVRNKELFEGVMSKRNHQLSGFPKAANDGARMGKAPLILFISDDVELEKDVLKIMAATMDDSEIGAMGIKLLFPKDSASPTRPAGKVQHIGHGMTISGDIIHPLVGWSSDNSKCCVSRKVISTTGACYLIRRSLYKKAGGFYEGYGFGTWEDVDLSFMVRSFGKTVYVNTDAVGYHYTGATVEKLGRGYPLQQNALIFKARWAQSGLFEWTDYLIW